MKTDDGAHAKADEPAFMKAPRCGAKTRKGTPCQCPAMPNGRCRMHGGKSTGPKTEEGKKRCGEARFVHGLYTKEAKERNRLFREVMELSARVREKAKGFLNPGAQE